VRIFLVPAERCHSPARHADHRGGIATFFLKDREADALLQSFTVRPTTFPRASGRLNIGFSAEQFSDDAVGEVWDGVRASILAQHRERQLAAALLGEELPAPTPNSAIRPDRADAGWLTSYLVFENGQKVLEGVLSAQPPASQYCCLSLIHLDPSTTARRRHQASGGLRSRLSWL
jgi:hypothetical protein